jgi:peptidoglycan LD-endopeptidase LytH
VADDIAWPLFSNKIRRGMVNHTFGMVRNGGKRAHQGWDFYAEPGTSIHAIASGTILKTTDASIGGDYGSQILLEFEFEGTTHYAMYAHLSKISVAGGQSVSLGQALGQTGNTGNAKTMKGEDQHLHFEIRTEKSVGRGLGGRRSPGQIFRTPPPLAVPILEMRNLFILSPIW